MDFWLLQVAKGRGSEADSMNTKRSDKTRYERCCGEDDGDGKDHHKRLVGFVTVMIHLTRYPGT